MFPGYKMLFSDRKRQVLRCRGQKKSAPCVTVEGRFYTTDAHCALASSLNLVSKHKELILTLFSAQCSFCTSIKPSWGPKHLKTRKKNNAVEKKKEYLFICRYFLCGMSVIFFLFNNRMARFKFFVLKWLFSLQVFSLSVNPYGLVSRGGGWLWDPRQVGECLAVKER